MTEHSSTYQDRLRRARIDAHLDQSQLAAKTGLSTSTISAVERGQQHITAPKLFAWARACGAGLEWIAGPTDPTPAPVDETLVELELPVLVSAGEVVRRIDAEARNR